jgi:anti-sigma regulatory factor (Ser/Thr protein kinase)
MTKSYKPIIQNIPHIREYIEQQMELSNFPAKITMQVCVAVEEIVTNAIHHGKLPPQSLIEIGLRTSSHSVMITICDRGIPFNPIDFVSSKQESSIIEQESGGLGLFFVKQFIDEIQYKRINNANHVFLVKNT